jgi:hypothetical protein
LLGSFLISKFQEERRAFSRVAPSHKVPIRLSIGGNVLQIKDMGAGGVAAYRGKEKDLEVNKEYPFKMALSLIEEEISGIMRIVNISENTYHCAFIDLTREHKEKIHFFVLERQKEELREKKKASSAFKNGVLTAETIPFPEGQSR